MTANGGRLTLPIGLQPEKKQGQTFRCVTIRRPVRGPVGGILHRQAFL